MNLDGSVEIDIFPVVILIISIHVPPDVLHFVQLSENSVFKNKSVHRLAKKIDILSVSTKMSAYRQTKNKKKKTANTSCCDWFKRDCAAVMLHSCAHKMEIPWQLLWINIALKPNNTALTRLKQANKQTILLFTLIPITKLVIDTCSFVEHIHTLSTYSQLALSLYYARIAEHFPMSLRLRLHTCAWQEKWKKQLVIKDKSTLTLYFYCPFSTMQCAQTPSKNCIRCGHFHVIWAYWYQSIDWMADRSSFESRYEIIKSLLCISNHLTHSLPALSFSLSLSRQMEHDFMHSANK